MSPLAGPFAVAAALLALGGALKLVRPDETTRALRLAHLPASPAAVRAGALAEMIVGAGALVFGSRLLAVLVAVSYAAFMGFVLLALYRDTPLSTCGCLGRVDTPPSVIHVAVNAAAVLVAVGVALDPGVGLADRVDEGLGSAAAFVGLTTVGVAAAFVALTALPRALRRPQ